jgi:putative heme-binding domain-containing protein
MASRASLAGPLLQAVQRGRIARTEVDASAQRQLRTLRDPELREKFFAIWPQSSASSNSKRDLFTRYKKLLNEEKLAQADLARGRIVYQQSCGVCHKFYGEGAQIGPELTGADRHNLDYLLENILSPSGIVPENYRTSTVSLKDERILNGIILGKTDQTLSLQTTTEKMTVPMAEVESIRESELSMMPDGLLDSLTEQQVSDLIAYLMSKTAPAPLK